MLYRESREFKEIREVRESLNSLTSLIYLVSPTFLILSLPLNHSQDRLGE